MIPLLAVIFTFQAGGSAREIPSTPVCGRCAIVIGRPKGVVGGPPNGLDANPADFAEDGRGRFVLMMPKPGQLPVVTDSTGRVVATLGRTGSGPGEFRRAILIAVDRDTAFVFDQFNSRISVLGPDLKFVRQGVAPLQTLAMTAGPDGLILNALMRDRDRAGFALHRVDRALEPGTSFDSVTTPIDPGFPWESVRRRFTRDRSGNTVSVTLADGYRFRVHSPKDRLLAEGVRRAEWLGSVPKSEDGVPGPMPRLAAVKVDSLGRLWVAVAVADPQWRRGIVVRKSHEGSWELVSTNPARYYDTVVEVIDLATWRLVAARRFDHSCRGFTKAGDLFCDEENADGSFRLEIRPVGLADSAIRSNDI